MAKNFYTEMLPEAEDARKKDGKTEAYDEPLTKYLKNDPRHEWFINGFDTKRIEEIKSYYKDRYNQKVE